MDKKVAAVVGSGPNGLAAAIALAQAGLEVTVYEKHEVIGGGCRSLELIQKGYIHDICSTVHLQVKLSPFFRKLPLEEFGLRWVTPPFALAHPFDGGRFDIDDSAKCGYRLAHLDHRSGEYIVGGQCVSDSDGQRGCHEIRM